MSRGTERFPVVEKPQMLPGNCFTCSGIKGPFIDTRIQKPIFGHVYLCVNCITEMFNMFPKPVEAKEPEPERITKEEYEATIHGLRDDLTGLLNSFLSALSDVPSFSVPEIESETNEELSDGNEGSEPSADQSPEDVSEPFSVEGPVSVPSDNGDGDSTTFNL